MKKWNAFSVGWFVCALLSWEVDGWAADPSGEPQFWSWAATPPMGWNSWDCYGPTVTEAEVKANAEYIADKLKSHGWQYVVVDIRWYVENDKAGGYNTKNPQFVLDEYGRWLPAVNRFPSAADGRGFKPLVDFVHDLGLKFGLHLMRGIPVEAVKRNTPILASTARAAEIYSPHGQCAWLKDMYTVDSDRPGAQAYYDSVFNLYAGWGVDYVKVDDLSRPYEQHRSEIEMIRRAIDGCGRPIVLSMSPGATPLDAAEHAQRHANLWRICDDFWDRWPDLKPQFARCRDWAPHVGPGHWPDADMLPVGKIGIRAERGQPRMTRFTHDEQITLMTLWCIARSPLMCGGDLPQNDAFTLSLLTNDEVLAVDQMSSHNRELFNHDGLVAWTANVPDSSDRYVALFNTQDQAEQLSPKPEIRVTLADIGLDGPCKVRDLWAGRNLGEFSGEFAAAVSFHGAGLYRISRER
jgi:alpha-galactosidase